MNFPDHEGIILYSYVILLPCSLLCKEGRKAVLKLCCSSILKLCSAGFCNQDDALNDENCILYINVATIV